MRRLRRWSVQSLLRGGSDLRRHGPAVPVQDLPGGRRLSRRLFDLGRMVLLPDGHGLPPALLRVQLPVRVRIPALSLLHPAADPVRADEAFGRPAVHLPSTVGTHSLRARPSVS